jgi:hypothetical protein
MFLKLKNITNQSITFVELTFARQSNLFACRYMQIALLKYFIDERKNFYHFYNFIIKRFSLKIAK